MRSTRTPLVIAVAVAFTAVVTVWAADYVVEDWCSYPIGTRGIPGDWKPQNWGQAAYDFEILADNGQPVLHLKSKGNSSTISRDLRGQFNLRETPVLGWRWKVITLPTGANACQKSTDDEAAQVYVAWLRFPETVRSLIIGYIRDSTVRVGTICKSQKTDTMSSCARAAASSASGSPSVQRRRRLPEDLWRGLGQSHCAPALDRFRRYSLQCRIVYRTNCLHAASTGVE